MAQTASLSNDSHIDSNRTVASNSSEATRPSDNIENYTTIVKALVIPLSLCGFAFLVYLLSIELPLSAPTRPLQPRRPPSTRPTPPTAPPHDRLVPPAPTH